MHSIRGRLMLAAGALTALALVAAWAALSMLLADFVDRRLLAELTATARGIMAASEWDEDEGSFRLDPPPADPRFETPRSGWFWQVADGKTVLARSPSLMSADLGVDGQAQQAHGLDLIVHREFFTAPGDGRRLTATVTLPAAEAAAELTAIRRPLAMSLVVLAVALIAAQVVAVQAGLSDLGHFARGLSRLRDGQAATVPRPKMRELVPLAAELDRLLEANRDQIARARSEAADLAHALKTPLAVLANRIGEEDRALIGRMERILRWHLTRARAAGRPVDATARSAVTPVLDDIALVLGPEARRRGLEMAITAEGAPDFRGDAEDLAEMVAALAENAVRWARHRIEILARGAAGRLILEIADDGPGIPPGERDRLLARGVRLDSSGHGLGLAIAADRAKSCGGSLTLAEAPGGGLVARLELPAAGS